MTQVDFGYAKNGLADETAWPCSIFVRPGLL